MGDILKSCACCCSEHLHFFCRKNDIDLLQCDRCGFIAADTNIDPDDFYDSHYFNGKEFLNYSDEREMREKHFRHLIGRILPHCPSKGSLLEVGAAYGFFLSVAKEHWHCEGVEVCVEAAREAARISACSITATDFNNFNSKKKYDIVCMWDAIEHFTRPADAVSKSHELLRAGGVFCLSTGNIGSMLARWQGSRWRLLYPPSHLSYFSRGTLELLLNRHSFEVIHISTLGFDRRLSQILFQLLGMRRWTSRFGRAVQRIVHGLPGSIYLDLKDIDLIIARKKEAA